MHYQEIITFWFEECSPENWFTRSDELDRIIIKRFSPIHTQASLGECYTWRSSSYGRLAEIIILDQFSRNIYRDSPKAFTQDMQALTLAQEAVTLKTDQDLEETKRTFLYMPYMHSESTIIHSEAERLFKSLPQTQGYKFELKHKAIIDRFNRYPHRNAVLGRTSTEEELNFLKQPESSF